MSGLSRILNFSRAFVSDPLAHWPFVQISRYAFGNTAGAKQNIYGGAQLAYCRLAGRWRRAPVEHAGAVAKARQLRRHGLVQFEDPIVPADLVARIRDRCDEIIRSEGMKDDKIIVLAGQDLVRKNPEVLRVLDIPLVRGMVSEFFGGGFHIDDVVYRRTFHVEEEVTRKGEVYSDYWHCDSSPTSELAMFINLLDVDDQSGPTMIVDKPNTRKFVRRYYKIRTQEALRGMNEAIDAQGAARAFTGRAGTMLLAQSTKCLHRASIPAKGRHRDWLSFRLYPVKGKTVSDRIYKDPVYRFTHGKAV